MVPGSNVQLLGSSMYRCPAPLVEVAQASSAALLSAAILLWRPVGPPLAAVVYVLATQDGNTSPGHISEYPDAGAPPTMPLKSSG